MICACGCGRETRLNKKGIPNRFLIGHNKPFLGMKHTGEYKKKMSASKIGDLNPSKRCDVRKKISLGRKNIPSPMKGKHHSEDTKKKLSEARKGDKSWCYGRRGELCHNWKGGKKLTDMRHTSKRRMLGTHALNKPLNNTVGHHINLDYIVYVPAWINNIPHNNNTGKNVGYVNALALFWLVHTNQINDIGDTNDFY